MTAQPGWQSRSAAAWDALVAAVATGAAVYVPLSLLPGFVDPARTVGVEWLLTAVFTADAVVQAQRLRRVPSPRLGLARLGVVADVVAALPFFLIGSAPMLLLRLAKLTRVVGAMRAVGRHRVGPVSRLRLVWFAYWLALTVHLVASGFLALGGIPTGPGDAERYVDAVYWGAETLTTVGYGDIVPRTSPQKLYAVGVMLMGVGLYAFLIGNIASLLSNLDPLRVAHLEQRERLDAFVRYRALPVALRRRIQAYHDYLWEQGLVADEDDVLATLPPSLRDDVALHLRRDLVEGVPLFQTASDAFRREIALRMHSFVALPGDVIVRAGQPGREMFVLARGRVEVIGDGGRVLRELHDGDFFGEVALVHDVERTATVRAVTASDLYVLDRAMYRRVAEGYPEVAAALAEAARQRTEVAQALSPPRH